ncbi:hypothetical protein [Pseudomonas syringae]|uniref:Uncharacterized protein n=1 Tax=Pseudomonas syringae pv. syringae TaxID=321 RepID=A0AB35JHZ6_PSESY|nr:hypothetical protein [Pseudomonas syringae]MBI6750378.1 hypothetical protein [Pseudomonas syringae]MBI6769179.1 hypothetical protein [Pseudomonas syringae]MBI6778077.1 hypothetical protein [Pseudomonas syringae]MBI6790605.1 hypothetical protein [Pseudomonas syringae]MBI6800728.1 hypothetical protein [Pseudomonas syringae]
MTRDTENWVKQAEKEVHACLNYGSVLHDKTPTSKELELAYQHGDLSDQVSYMRRFAAALNELAEALEAQDDSDDEPAVVLQIYQTPSGLWVGRLLSDTEELGECAACTSPDAVAYEARKSGIIPDRVEILETAPVTEVEEWHVPAPSIER